MLPDDPQQAIALVVILVGLAVLGGSVIYLYVPFGWERTVENENRIAPRRRVLKAAKIEFFGSEIHCTVRNISDTGAALELANPLQCPVAFVLAIPSDGSTRHCRVVWRRGKRIGVKFASSPARP